MIDSGETSRVGHGINLVGIPTGLLASAAFNDYPLPLSIGGVHELNAALFEMLRLSETPEEAGSAFQNYMRAVFGVNGESVVAVFAGSAVAPPMESPITTRCV